MRVSRWLVTTIDSIGPEGREKKLAVVPSEAIPEQDRMKIRQGQITLLLQLLKRGKED
jgi:hypothetical protein